MLTIESSRISTSEARRLSETVWPMLGVLFPVARDLERRGFSPKDPVFVSLVEAYDAIRRLNVELHLEAISPDVERPCDEDPDADE